MLIGGFYQFTKLFHLNNQSKKYTTQNNINPFVFRDFIEEKEKFEIQVFRQFKYCVKILIRGEKVHGFELII